MSDLYQPIEKPTFQLSPDLITPLNAAGDCKKTLKKSEILFTLISLHAERLANFKSLSETIVAWVWALDSGRTHHKTDWVFKLS